MTTPQDAPRRAGRLVLLTANHPFTANGGEVMFVAPELPALARRFAHVTLVPLRDDGACVSLPPAADGTVEVDRALAARWRGVRRLVALATAPCWPGFAAQLWQGLRRGGWVGAARVWRWAAVAQATWAWARASRAVAEADVLYTYWRGGQTLAALRWRDAAGARAPDAVPRVVTRVHRYELYDDAFSPPFQPWWAATARVDRFAPVARHGADHLAARGVEAARVQLARLGVAAGAPSRASDDGVLRVVGASTLTPVKRVDFTARALACWARRHPTRRFVWTHFGDGPTRAAVDAEVAAFPPNLRAELRGRVDAAAVRTHHADAPVDAFVLLSASEGLPVSIQEALAAGIPVVATAVGGVPEAVDEAVGALLTPAATEDDVATTLDRLLIDASAEARAARRAAARARWQRDFDSDANHAAFAEALQALAASRAWSTHPAMRR